VIVVAGESLVDLVVRLDGSVSATPGGGPCNVARALARLGARASFLGRVSTDRFGQILTARLAADGVDLGCLVPSDDPTLLAIADIDADGAATYRFYTEGTAAAGLAVADFPGGLPAATTALHVGSLGLVLEPMAATIEAITTAVPSTVLVMADPNCRPSAIRDPAAYRARLDRVLARVDVLEAGNQPQQRRLTAAGGPDEDHELAVVDGEVQVVDREDVAVLLGDVVEGHGGHAHTSLHRGIAGPCIQPPFGGVDGPRTRSRLELVDANTSGCRAWTTLGALAAAVLAHGP